MDLIDTPTQDTGGDHTVSKDANTSNVDDSLANTAMEEGIDETPPEHLTPEQCDAND